MSGLTLDTGPLIAVDRGDRRVWRFIKAYVAAGHVPTVPSPVVVEAWRGGRQARLAKLLRDCDVEPLTEAAARRAGELCGRTRASDPVDAVIVESAARRDDVVLTSDPGDLGRLAARLGTVTIISVSET